jgi:hypothetical protein
MKKEYLGDGVYAAYEEGSDSILLTTEDGINVTNEIYLEAHVISALNCFVARLKKGE